MVTPCMPKCEPVNCDIRDYTGQSRTVESYGRKKRDVLVSRSKRMADMEETLVVSTLQIVDRLGKRNRLTHKPNNVEDVTFKNVSFANDDRETHILFNSDERDASFDRCIDDTSLIAGAIVFLVVQAFLLLLWTLLWKRKRSAHSKEIVTPDSHSSADSLSYIYETGIPRRMN
jgi:hypothetical protein